jgi:multidrug efflux pump subunit AcrA (membrane-fusion protein)
VKGSVVRRLRPIVLGAAAIAALAAAGCGEKSEPAVHPPTTAATTSVPTTTPTTAAPGTVTRTEQTPTAPVPKTTP